MPSQPFSRFALPRRLFTGLTLLASLVLLAVLLLLAACGGSGGGGGGGPSSGTTVPRFVNAHPASVVIGQPNMVVGSANQGGAAAANTLSSPLQAIVVGGKLVVADSSNSRVLIYNTIPATADAAADVVIGQPDMVSSTGSGGNQGLNNPRWVASDGTRLAISDDNNRRVVILNALPTTNQPTFDVVVGNPDFDTTVSVPCDASTLGAPQGVAFAGGKLLVADGGRARVLVWNSVPTTNGQAADQVIGQANFTTCSGTADQSTMENAFGIWSDGMRLAVTDDSALRVLLWDAFPTTNGAPADWVLGQPDFTTAAAPAPSAYTTNGAQGVWFNGTQLFVSDYNEPRVLIWNEWPTAINPPADRVIGQGSFTSTGSGTSATKLSGFPFGVFAQGQQLFVADSQNNRVLIFNSSDTLLNLSSGMDASVVIGQPDFVSNTANAPSGSTNAAGLSGPFGNPVVAGGRLYVPDEQNFRVLGFDAVPTVNNATADFVLGQANFTANTPVSPPTQSSLKQYSVASEGTRLAVADYGNSRILISNALPTTTLPAFDVVVGQPGFTTDTAACTDASSLTRPESVFIGNGRLIVPDSFNNRVLVWNSVPADNGLAADLVLGQADDTSCDFNRTGVSTPGANTLSSPTDVWSDGSRLLVADYSNGRVLLWGAFPQTPGQDADIVLGAADLVTATYTVSATSFAGPYFLTSNGEQIFVVDESASRVMVWNAFPTTNGQPADIVLGQADFTTSTTGLSAARFNTPGGIALSGRQLIVSDNQNNRVLIFDGQ